LAPGNHQLGGESNGVVTFSQGFGPGRSPGGIRKVLFEPPHEGVPATEEQGIWTGAKTTRTSGGRTRGTERYEEKTQVKGATSERVVKSGARKSGCERA